MMDSATLTESDLALAEALQAAPRAPWTAIGQALGCSAMTAARRWQRLSGRRLAWVTAAPGVPVSGAYYVAYVEITCAPGSARSVAEVLAGDCHALSVALTAGNADLLVTVATPSLSAMSRYLLDRVDHIPGVTRSRARLATHTYREGSTWRLGSLPDEAVRLLQASAGPPSPPSPAVLQPGDHEIIMRLGADGRATYAELAEAAGTSPATARRRVAHLLASRSLQVRTEVAAAHTRWRVPVSFSLDAPTGRLADVARRLAVLRQVRLCVTLAGAPPILLVAWLDDIEETHRFEAQLARTAPGVTVVDRLLTWRSVKRMGRVLDEHGRAIHTVPMDVWADPLSCP